MAIKIIELCRTNKEFQPPHYYKANGQRISKEHYEMLEALSQQTDCLLTTLTGNNYNHFLTVRIAK